MKYHLLLEVEVYCMKYHIPQLPPTVPTDCFNEIPHPTDDFCSLSFQKSSIPIRSDNGKTGMIILPENNFLPIKCRAQTTIFPKFIYMSFTLTSDHLYYKL